ncbi:hypothetical protein PYCCODRAFT_1133715 [Trametes coccinea BRFM310]|uniref:Uncharacterized protein n=1 Tax=Trametes coccinea (strain BRFM310) TaxID=1353009 RepID=A0A1Y2IAU6_TRAC3|nr:hypothetical protein PYCCODRAFT_1133715 [Trametes coccinea BRFM310]
MFRWPYGRTSSLPHVYLDHLLPSSCPSGPSLPERSDGHRNLLSSSHRTSARPFIIAVPPSNACATALRHVPSTSTIPLKAQRLQDQQRLSSPCDASPQTATAGMLQRPPCLPIQSCRYPDALPARAFAGLSSSPPSPRQPLRREAPSTAQVHAQLSTAHPRRGTHRCWHWQRFRTRTHRRLPSAVADLEQVLRRPVPTS